MQRWRGTATNWKLVVFELLLFGGVVWIMIRGPEAPPSFIWVFVITAFIFAISFAWVDVVIDDEGLRASVGPTGLIPIKKITRAEITGAETITARPRNYGGWGLRHGGLPGAPRGWAIVVRAGDSLMIQRDERKPFVITVDDAQGAVEALGFS